MLKFLEAAGIGAAMNVGTGFVALVAVPLVYWFASREQPQRKLSWLSLLGMLVLVASATGLAGSTIARFMFSAASAYKASVFSILGAFVFAAAFLGLAWQIKARPLSFASRLFVVFLIVWLVIGGGYLSIIMLNRTPLGDAFWLVAFSPLLIALGYILVVTTTKWLMGAKQDNI